MTAAHGATLEQPAVMLTRPARIPLQSATMSYTPVRYLIQKIVVTPAEAPAIVVVTADRVTSSHEFWFAIIRAEPGLKPYLQRIHESAWERAVPCSSFQPMLLLDQVAVCGSRTSPPIAGTFQGRQVVQNERQSGQSQ